MNLDKMIFKAREVDIFAELTDEEKLKADLEVEREINQKLRYDLLYAKDCECSALEDMVDNNSIVDIVEKWSAAHPHKTMQDAFLEQWPNAKLSDENVLMACPATFDSNFNCHFGDILYNACPDCRRKFWMQEVE